MVDIKSKVYVQDENNNFVGAEVIIYSEEGDNIGSVSIVNEEDYTNLKKQLSDLQETSITVNNLEERISNIQVNAQTLDNLSSTDFARATHYHEEQFPPINHSSAENTYGLSSTSEYGHSKIIDSLNRTFYAEGEVLSAKQGNVLNNLINTLKNNLGTWTTQKIGNYGTLRVNTLLRLVYFTYYRENYTVSKNVTLHTGYIPAQYRFSGSYKTCASSNYTLLTVNNNGNIDLKTIRTKSSTGTLRGWWVWLY